MVGLQLTGSLSQTLVSRSYAQQADAQIWSLRSQAEGLRRAIELEVSSTWIELGRAHDTVALTAEALQTTRGIYDQQLLRFRGGEISATDIIDTDMELLAATLRHLHAHIEVHTAAAQFAKATGQSTPLTLTSDQSDADRIPAYLGLESGHP